MDSLCLWAGFSAFVIGRLALVLSVIHRKAHEVSLREVGAWSAFCLGLALAIEPQILLGEPGDPSWANEEVRLP